MTQEARPHLWQVESGLADARLHVAKLKALVRLTEVGAPLSSRDKKLFRLAMAPRQYVVRVYVLKAHGLVPADVHSPSDAYLKASLLEPPD